MTINQSLKYACVPMAASLFLCWVLTNSTQAFAFFLGAFWGLINVYILAALLKSVLLTKAYLLSFFILLIKFPILYWVGYQLLKVDKWNPWFLVWGLSMAFISLIGEFFLRYSARRA